jgi:hypothetical protein
MIDEQNGFEIPVVSGGRLTGEINWSKDETIAGGKMIKFNFISPDGKHTFPFFVKTEQLHAFLMVVGSTEQIEDLLPVKVTTIKKIERLLTFEWQASRDYRRGEKITVKAPWIDEVPNEIETLAGSLKGRETKHYRDLLNPKFIALP